MHMCYFISHSCPPSWNSLYVLWGPLWWSSISGVFFRWLFFSPCFWGTAVSLFCLASLCQLYLTSPRLHCSLYLVRVKKVLFYSTVLIKGEDEKEDNDVSRGTPWCICSVSSDLLIRRLLNSNAYHLISNTEVFSSMNYYNKGCVRRVLKITLHCPLWNVPFQ